MAFKLGAGGAVLPLHVVDIGAVPMMSLEKGQVVSYMAKEAIMGRIDKYGYLVRFFATISMEWKMPADIIPSLKTLPQRSATQVKNRWADVVRDVRKLGSVAITQHNQVEMVVMNAETYQKISAHAEEVRARGEAGLAELSDDFDRRLASFKTDGIRDKVENAMSARGRIKRPAKAGATY